MTLKRELAAELVLSLLNHLMISGELNPHAKGVWLPEADSYVCACGIPVKWNLVTRSYVPR